MAWALNSRWYPRQQVAAERPVSWMVTQLDSDVASRPTRSRREARLSVARLQSAGAGSGLETKRSALGTHLFVDTYEYLYVHCCTAAAAVSHNMEPKIPRQVALAHSPRLFAARPEMVSLGSDAWILRAVQRTQRVSSRRQTTTAGGLGVCSTLCPHNKSVFSRRKTVSICRDRVKI